LQTLGKLLLSSRWRFWITAATAAFTGTALLAAVALIFCSHLRATLDAEFERHSRPIAAFAETIELAFDALSANGSVAACGPADRAAMGVVSFAHPPAREVIRFSGNRVICTTSREVSPPLDLGAPTLFGPGGDLIWEDQKLPWLPESRAAATIIRRGDYGIAFPSVFRDRPVYGWMQVEIVSRDGQNWNYRRGQRGLHARLSGRLEEGFSVQESAFFRQGCVAETPLCVSVAAPLNAVIEQHLPTIFLALLLLPGAPFLVGTVVDRRVRCAASFERRFLRHLSEGRIVCHYQPLVHVETGEIRGCEVLCRWRDLDGRIVPPLEFLEVVKQRNLTMVLTRMVVKKSLGEISAWDATTTGMRISYNVFPRDFSAKNIRALFLEHLDHRPSLLIAVEITEDEQFDQDAVAETAKEVAGLGISVMVDDFGIGFSNICTIARLPAHAVKVDKSFALAPFGSVLSGMLPAIVAMIRQTAKSVIVEGVHSPETLAVVEALDVDYVQGFHFSPPVPADVFADMLRRQPFAHRRTTTRRVQAA
jgi:sensor c-di-GMP phosphodiesterase-like protein